MHDVTADIRHRKIVVFQEAFDGVPQFGPNQLRNIRGQHDIKAGVIDLPTHQVLGIGVERRTRVDNRVSLCNGGL